MASTVKPYRIRARVQNNRLWKSICQIWPDVKTQTDAAQKIGWEKGRFGSLLNLKVFPGRIIKGEIRWWPSVIQLSEFLGEDINWLFEPRLYNRDNGPPSLIDLEVGIDDLVSHDIGSLPPPVEDIVDSHLVEEAFEREMEHLNPRVKYVLRERMKGKPLVDIGKELQLSKERVRRLETRGLIAINNRLKDVNGYHVYMSKANQ